MKKVLSTLLIAPILATTLINPFSASAAENETTIGQSNIIYDEGSTIDFNLQTDTATSGSLTNGGLLYNGGASTFAIPTDPGGSWKYVRTGYGTTKAERNTIALIAFSFSVYTKIPEGARILAGAAATLYGLNSTVGYTKHVTYQRGTGINSETYVQKSIYSDSTRKNLLVRSAVITNRSGVYIQY